MGDRYKRHCNGWSCWLDASWPNIEIRLQETPMDYRNVIVFHAVTWQEETKQSLVQEGDTKDICRALNINCFTYLSDTAAQQTSQSFCRLLQKNYKRNVFRLRMNDIADLLFLSMLGYLANPSCSCLLRHICVEETPTVNVWFILQLHWAEFELTIKNAEEFISDDSPKPMKDIGVVINTWPLKNYFLDRNVGCMNSLVITGTEN